MRSPLGYLDSVIDHKINQLAQIIELNELNPCSVLLEAAMSIGLVAPIFNAINEEESVYDTVRNNLIRWRKERESRRGPRIPGNVGDLVDMLKAVVKQLTTKYGIDNKQIIALISQAKDSAAISAPTIEKPTTKAEPITKTEPVSKPVVKEKPPAERPASVEKDPQLPPWFGDMTKGEQEWYNKLTPNQKRQFIMRHDMVVRGDDGSLSKAGNKYLSGDDLSQAQILSNQRHKDWMRDNDATFRASAGLLNRHKIRQKLQKDIKSWKDKDLPPLPAFDDLLQKDHHHQLDNMLSEWCHLAGVKKTKKGI